MHQPSPFFPLHLSLILPSSLPVSPLNPPLICLHRLTLTCCIISSLISIFQWDGFVFVVVFTGVRLLLFLLNLLYFLLLSPASIFLTMASLYIPLLPVIVSLILYFLLSLSLHWFGYVLVAASFPRYDIRPQHNVRPCHIDFTVIFHPMQKCQSS